MFAMSSITVHQFLQIEQEIGQSRGSTALVIMIMSAFNIGGRLFGGFLGDRAPKRLVLGSALLGTGIAILILAWATNLNQAIVFGAIYGTSWGICTPIGNAYGKRWRRLVGHRGLEPRTSVLSGLRSNQLS